MTRPATRLAEGDDGVDPGRLLAAALGYAAAGIAVMPLHTPQFGGCTCAAGPQCGSAGKHPWLRRGLHEATIDRTLIRRWWSRWPNANVGLATGGGLDVCDVDTPDALRRLLDLLDVIRPEGPLVRTGHGWHLWYASGGLPNRVGVIPGVDWRGTGGLVVAPPSLHATGRRYRFAQPYEGRLLPGVPEVLARLVRPAAPAAARAAADVAVEAGDPGRYALAALTGEIHRIQTAPRPAYAGGRRVTGGGRNDALVRAAFRLGQLAAGSGGLDAHVVWPRLADAAHSVGLGDREARRTIASGWRAGLRHPRTPATPRRRLRR